MIPLVFVLAAVLIVAAVVLLVVDAQRRSTTSGWNRRRARKAWARTRNAEYNRVDRELSAQWHRTPAGDARAVVSGFAHGREMHLCDINGITVIALRRSLASDEVLSVSKTADSQLPLVAKQSDHFVNASTPELIHRIFDDRANEFLGSIPSVIQSIWSENEWSIAELSVDARAREWDLALANLAVFSDIARRLPPVVSELPAIDESHWDPTRPQLGSGWEKEPERGGLQAVASLSEETKPASAIDVAEVTDGAEAADGEKVVPFPGSTTQEDSSQADELDVEELAVASTWRPERASTLDPTELPSRTVSKKMGVADKAEPQGPNSDDDAGEGGEKSQPESEIPALGQDPEHSRMKIRGGHIIRPNEKPSSIFSDSDE